MREVPLALLVLFAALAPITAQEVGAAQAVGEKRADELERMVRQDCGSCHGMTLNGGLGPALTAERLDGADPMTLSAIILDGVPDTPMPPWRGLISEAEARWIAEYLLKGEAP